MHVQNVIEKKHYYHVITSWKEKVSMLERPSLSKSVVLSTRHCLSVLFTAMFIVLFSLSPHMAKAAQVSLKWIAPTSYSDGTPLTDLAGYKVYAGNASHSYQQDVSIGTQTSYTLDALDDGATYYFAVTAFNSSGVESAISNEVSKSFPALPVTHLITATSGFGGSITALNNSAVNQAFSGTTTISGVTVLDGASQAFTIAASTGYQIVNVTVDGASVGAVASYSFSSVKSDHTISATFALKSFTVTASAGTGGSISPTGTTTLNYGSSQTYAITPGAGYRIANVTVDGISVGAVSSYTLGNISASHLIVASFMLNSYSISASTSVNGTISPEGSTSVNSGGSQTYSITPATGYKIAGVTVDGISVGAQNTYTFSNIAANHTIAASFTAKIYTVSASAGTGGTISPVGTNSLGYGSNQTYTISPNAGYIIAGVTVDGVAVGAVTSYVFSNVTANHTISAAFSTATSSNIPRSGWKLKYADSQETVGQNGAAINAFDGKNGTMWHTQWKTSNPACPHEIQINLGKAYSIDSFSYLPRQDGQINGTIAKYEFYVSSDGVNWGNAVATGTFANNTTLKKISFGAKNGQYIRLRALSEVNGKPWTSAAEISVTGK